MAVRSQLGNKCREQSCLACARSAAQADDPVRCLEQVAQSPALVLGQIGTLLEFGHEGTMTARLRVYPCD